MDSLKVFDLLQVNESTEDINVTLTVLNVLDSSLTTVFLPVVYILIFIVGLPTNAMAIWVFIFRTKKKHPVTVLMVNLALADLLFIIWLPLKIAYHFNGNNWIFGEPLCKVLVGFFYGNMYCSTIFIACISVVRYRSVVQPLSQNLKNRVAVCVSVCVWFTVWLITVPLYLYDQTVSVTYLNIVTCHDVTLHSQVIFPISFFLTMGIVGYVVPCIVCTVAYVLMFCFLRSSMSHTHANKSKRKAIILIIIVLVMFLVCFTPSNIMLMVHYSLMAANIQNNGYGFYIVTLCLSSLNSCVDPFVYYFISVEFREHVKNTPICHREHIERVRVAIGALKLCRKTSTPPTQAPKCDNQTSTAGSLRSAVGE
ncbi:proteinase-activated receptor 2-like isoform X1 [Brachyhypopomus gauderio]|uniref:proteinase-activated receptor 2-like isoform X1 n=1 Tax=Brachyhypopomus gauderio TaxID=698409 RepID=UPI0040412AA4